MCSVTFSDTDYYIEKFIIIIIVLIILDSTFEAKWHKSRASRIGLSSCENLCDNTLYSFHLQKCTEKKQNEEILHTELFLYT